MTDNNNLDVYFKSEWAHYFIIFCALLSIVWGLVNVFIVSTPADSPFEGTSKLLKLRINSLQIRNIDITNPEPIKTFFLEEVGIYSLNDEEANQDESVKAKEQAEEVIRQLEYIGGLITTVSISFKSFVTCHNNSNMASVVRRGLKNIMSPHGLTESLSGHVIRQSSPKTSNPCSGTGYSTLG